MNSSGRVIVFAHTQIPCDYDVCADGKADTEGNNQAHDRNVRADGCHCLIRNKMSEDRNVCKVIQLL